MYVCVRATHITAALFTRAIDEVRFYFDWNRLKDQGFSFDISRFVVYFYFIFLFRFITYRYFVLLSKYCRRTRGVIVARVRLDGNMTTDPFALFRRLSLRLLRANTNAVHYAFLETKMERTRRLIARRCAISYTKRTRKTIKRSSHKFPYVYRNYDSYIYVYRTIICTCIYI